MEDLSRWPLRRWARLALIAAAVAVVLYVIVAAWAVIVPFILGAILAWIILPAINWIERRLPRFLRRSGAARLIAIFSVYAIVLALIVAFFYFFVPSVLAEATAIFSRGISISASLSGFQAWYQRTVPADVRAFIASQLPSTAAGWLNLIQRNLFSGLTANITATIAIIFAYIIVPFWLIYVLYDVGRFRRAVLSLVPESLLPDVANLGRILSEVAGDYVRGQLFVAVTIGVLIGVSFYLVGIDFPIVLGLLATIGDLIPTFGPILALIPAVIIAFFERPILAVWAVVITIAVHEFENLFVGPRVVGASVRIRPGVIIILLIIAGFLWGLLGLLLVVPITATLRDVFRYLYLRTLRVSPNEALRRVHRSWRRTSPRGEERNLA